MRVKCYRFHPDTGADANDIDTSQATEAERIELASLVRAGAKFYWHMEDDGVWARIERSNYAFVLRVTGQPVEWIEAK
jgi:hypothetical protein